MHQNVGSNPGTGQRFPFVKSEIVLIFDSFISGEATCAIQKMLFSRGCSLSKKKGGGGGL